MGVSTASELGDRLRECTEAVTQVEGVNIQEILGQPDYLKFRSCMTLFAPCDLRQPDISESPAQVPRR